MLVKKNKKKTADTGERGVIISVVKGVCILRYINQDKQEIAGSRAVARLKYLQNMGAFWELFWVLLTALAGRILGDTRVRISGDTEYQEKHDIQRYSISKDTGSRILVDMRVQIYRYQGK